MSQQAFVGNPAAAACPIRDPGLPRWLADRLEPGLEPKTVVSVDKGWIEERKAGPVTLFRVAVPGASALEPREFQSAVEQSYHAVATILRKRERFPLRFWNYVPRIASHFAAGLTGYQLFNAGRHAALRRWHREAFSQQLTSASAVGSASGDFALYVLASRGAGNPVDNPRQIQPHRYSRRYGPVPPAFARATVLPDETASFLGCRAVVSGTASIVGEDTQHLEDIGEQLLEVERNLVTLSNVALGHGFNHQRALARYRDLRVYTPQREHREPIERWLDKLFPRRRSSELIHTDLCRSNLLVEVEGTLVDAGAEMR